MANYKTLLDVVDERNQLDLEDNLGYVKEEEESIDLPLVEVHRGPLSETLIVQLSSQPELIITGEDKSGSSRTIRLRMSPCSRFINAEVISFGYPTGNFFNLAFKNNKGTWYYNKQIRDKLELIDNENHWLAKIHCYYRV